MGIARSFPLDRGIEHVLNMFRIQSRDVKQYKKIFFRFFKTNLSEEKWCWPKRSTIHTALVKKGDSHAELNIYTKYKYLNVYNI